MTDLNQFSNYLNWMKFLVFIKLLAPKLRKSRWNLLLLSKNGNSEQTSAFSKKSTREIAKIEFRCARQETDHTKLISLRTIQIPYIFDKKYYYQKKNIFRVKKGLIRTILSFFFEVTSVGALWYDNGMVDSFYLDFIVN